jgi:hypothetical protein
MIQNQNQNIDTPISVICGEDERLSPTLPPIITTQTTYEPECTAVMEYETTETTQPPQLFIANESFVDHAEHFNASCTPEPVLQDIPYKFTLKYVPYVAEISQVKLDPCTQISPFAEPTSLVLPKRIVCPCCIVMTPKHECKIDPLPENEKSDDPRTPTHAPCPVELTTDPPDSSEWWVRLMNDPDFERRFTDFTDTSPDCKIQ